MTVWVDGDSCPRPVRDILCRACIREGILLNFVANRSLPLNRKADRIRQIITSREEGSADRYIIENADIHDLVITRDIPLAAELVDRNIPVLNDRGVVYNRENVRERLAERDFNQMLREAGLGDEKSGNFGPRETKAFANAFDRTLRQMMVEEQFRKAKAGDKLN